MYQLKLSTKILLSSIFYMAFFGIVVLIWLVPTYNKAVNDLIDLKTQHLVESTVNILDYYNRQVEANVLTLEEAQRQAAATIETLRYEDIYFFIMNTSGRMIMHPIDKSLLTKDLHQVTDPTGKIIFNEFVKTSTSKGSGFVRYLWPKPGSTKNLDKITYVKFYPAWNWILGNGIYVEDALNQVHIAQLKTEIFIVFFINIVIGLLMSILISRTISRPFNISIRNLTAGADQVAAASAQLSASSQQLSGGSTEQASAIEETSTTLEESAAMIQQNTEHTKQAALLAKQAKELSDKGNQEMQDMISSMAELKKSSAQIGRIIKVIDDIAFQTNILALNAAIEAARAGEAGMGFAVVAEEVRNLAQRSAQAAKDTTAIIESNIDLSDKGTHVVELVKDSLAEITLQTKKVSELMEEIAAASQEQAQGIEQVNQAIAQVELVTQQNASTAEENAAASEELNTQSQSMMGIIHQLNLLINGQKTALEKLGIAKKSEASKPASISTNIAHGTHLASPVVKEGRIHTTPVQHQAEESAHEKAKVINPEDVIPLEKDKF